MFLLFCLFLISFVKCLKHKVTFCLIAPEGSDATRLQIVTKCYSRLIYESSFSLNSRLDTINSHLQGINGAKANKLDHRTKHADDSITLSLLSGANLRYRTSWGWVVSMEIKIGSVCLSCISCCNQLLNLKCFLDLYLTVLLWRNVYSCFIESFLTVSFIRWFGAHIRKNKNWFLGVVKVCGKVARQIPSCGLHVFVLALQQTAPWGW